MTTRSPAVVPAGAETDSAVPDGSSFLDDALTATAIVFKNRHRNHDDGSFMLYYLHYTTFTSFSLSFNTFRLDKTI